ncbi:hypothetical protein P3T76_014118 [Phytophthora citrophthora]|uniref:Uncharacterized protein n=1 Tax=Phytophthora citrophthora TaxID=4793 RepID=A0AAD9G2X4_9STRA|nr:hypothetical protein P3T76_014118 [Phytophthora citrophthora]
MPEREIGVAMSKGHLDIQTVIPHEKFAGAGIRFVEKAKRTTCLEKGIAYSDALWKQFWQSFRNTWLKTYGPSVWNLYGLDADMISRTNNLLERFNREMNAALTAPHPSLPSFVAIIESLSRRYVDRIEDMLKCRAKKRRRHDA